MKQLLIFSDLDGTLLDYSTYSFEMALSSIQLLKEKEIPLVISSSKTKKEIEYYRRKLSNNHPFISENGGGIFIPKDYFNIKLIKNSVPPSCFAIKCSTRLLSSLIKPPLYLVYRHNVLVYQRDTPTTQRVLACSNRFFWHQRLT